VRVEFRASFAKDLRSVRDKGLSKQIKEAIELVEQVQRLEEIANLKKLRGKGNYFRIRIGEYRIGIAVENDTVTFVRCLNRKEIYRYFP
jgi:mRNA interferase RelE/StbE